MVRRMPAKLKRAYQKSPLSPLQRLRARAIENQVITESPEKHSRFVISKKRVERAEKALASAKDSRTAITAARARAQAMTDSAKMWPRGMQWVKKSGAWVRRKTIPVMHPVDSVIGKRVEAREKTLRTRKKGRDDQRTNLVEAARLSRPLIFKDIERKMPAYKQRMLLDVHEAITALGKPPYSRRGQAALGVARDFLKRIRDPEQLMQFEVILGTLKTAIKKKDVGHALYLIETLNDLTTFHTSP